MIFSAKNSVFTALSIVLLNLGFISIANADHDEPRYQSSERSNTRYVYADVVGVEPILRYVTVSHPERVCEDVEYRRRSRRQHDTAGGTIAGGLLGGVIGRQFGSGSGRDAATIAGVLIGSAIGHDNEAKHSGRHSRDERRYTREECHTRYERRQEERIDGYNVTYRYQGELFNTRTEYEPGEKIRLAMTVRPVSESRTRRDYRDNRYSNGYSGRYESDDDDDDYSDYDYEDD